MVIPFVASAQNRFGHNPNVNHTPLVLTDITLDSSHNVFTTAGVYSSLACDKGQNKLNLASRNLSCGMYFVSVKSTDGLITKKLIIER